jgi:hypothetical protein
VRPGGTPISIESPNASVVASNCDIQGGFAGTGNIDLNPQFIHAPGAGPDNTWGTADDDLGDLRLQANSPAIDAGTNSPLLGIKTDLAGNPRFVDVPNIRDYGDFADMGAYERQVPVVYLFDAPKPSLRFTFDVDLNPATLDVGDLVLFNATTQSIVNFTPFTTVTYDATSRSATWTFSNPIPDGDYRATIAASNVSDTNGTPLSSDAIGNFFVFAGDSNRDRIVDIKDLAALSMNWQGNGKVFSQGDFNYDGKVDAADLGILSSHWQQTLPPPVAAAQPVSLMPTAPKRTATRVATLVL